MAYIKRASLNNNLNKAFTNQKYLALEDIPTIPEWKNKEDICKCLTSDDLFIGDEVKQPTLFTANIVEHPDHYGAGNGGIQCIEAMLQTFGKEATLAFCKLNAFKYIWRSDHKEKESQDMEKAKRYIEYWHVLNKLEGNSDDGSFHKYLNS